MNKKHRELLETYEVRASAAAKFAESVRPGLEVNTGPLLDPKVDSTLPERWHVVQIECREYPARKDTTERTFNLGNMSDILQRTLVTPDLKSLLLGNAAQLLIWSFKATCLTPIN